MSHKPQSTKARKVARALEFRQVFYDRKLSDCGDCHRPGGNPVAHGAMVVFKEVGDALNRIDKLGFSHLINPHHKLITLKGEGGLSFWKAADYLVNYCEFSYSKVGA